MKRYTIGLTFFLALMNIGCEDTKDDKLGYSFPKISKQTHYDEAGNITTADDNYYWNGNTRTTYYLENGEETDKKMSVFEYNKYGRHIKRTWYTSNGSIDRQYIYERDKWKFLNYKYYNEDGVLYRHRIFEWDGLTAEVLDGLDNNLLLYTSVYDEKAHALSSTDATSENLTETEWHPDYRWREINKKSNGIIHTNYEWSDNKCTVTYTDENSDDYNFEVNEFDDIIKTFYPNGSVRKVTEYLTDRFEPYYTIDE